MLAGCGQAFEYGAHGHGHRLHHQGLFIAEVGGDGGDLALVGGEGIAPAAAGPAWAPAQGGVLAQGMVAGLAVRAERVQFLAEAGGALEPGVHDHAVAGLKLAHALAHLADHAHDFVTEVEALVAGQRGRPDAGIGIDVEQGKVGGADAAESVAHPQPAGAGQGRVGQGGKAGRREGGEDHTRPQWL